VAKIADRLPEVTEEQWLQCNEYNRKITQEFLEESTQLSPKTIETYRSALRQFFWFVKENLDNKSILELKGRDYLKYQNSLVRREMSYSAVKFRRSTISSLNNYIVLYYGDTYETFKNFITKAIASPPRSFVHEKKPLNAEEYEMLLKALEEKQEWQKIAYLQFSYATGCRRAETRQLLKEVVNYPLITKEIKIKNEKGEEEIKTAKYYVTHDIRCKGKGKIGKIRKLQFSEEAMQSIKKWLEVRGEDDCPYVFVSKYREIKQVDESTFNSWCEGFSDIVGRRVHPHQMREKRATDMVVVEGKNIKAAQKLLGHLSQETTNIYVIREDTDDSDEAFI
jgi:integrase